MTRPQHLDRLGAFDASFLLQEGRTSHAHVGGFVIIEGPPPSLEVMLAHIDSRLDGIPRYRQRLASTSLDRARPVWVDDTRFDLAYHVRHVALPSPGNRAQFQTAVANAYSQPLDRTRPLWEQVFVEGLEGGAYAMIFKVHHSMIDGTAAVDLLKMLCDISPDPAPAATALVPWHAQPTPDRLDLLTHGIREAATTASQLAAGAVEAALEPGRTLRRMRDVAEGGGGLIMALLRTPPTTPLTTETGRNRRFIDVHCQLSDAKLVKNTFGGTVNDVVMSVVSGALRTFLEHRDVDTTGLELSALVPVSVRAEDERGHMGNRIAVLRARLPVYVEDPVARLGVVTAQMTALKNSKQAMGSEAMLGAQNYLPPMILPLTTRINISPRMHTLMVTNIPGPQLPLYVLGRKLLEVVPIAMLHPRRAMSIAITSYDGQLNYGVLGDYDTMPDLDVVADAIEAELAELVARCRPRALPDPLKPQTVPEPRPVPEIGLVDIPEVVLAMDT